MILFSILRNGKSVSSAVHCVDVARVRVGVSEHARIESSHPTLRSNGHYSVTMDISDQSLMLYCHLRQCVCFIPGVIIRWRSLRP